MVNTHGDSKSPEESGCQRPLPNGHENGIEMGVDPNHLKWDDPSRNSSPIRVDKGTARASECLLPAAPNGKRQPLFENPRTKAVVTRHDDEL